MSRPVRAVLLLPVVLGIVVVLAATAWATSPGAAGWWRASPDGPLSAALATDVPEDGLLVQGGPSDDQPSAYSALRYDLTSGETALELTLQVAANSLTTGGSEVRVCRLVDPSFTPARGGAMSEAPRYDCRSSATAKVADDSLRFDLSRLPGGGDLAVALVPIGSTTRVVIDRPGSTSLRTRRGSSAPPTSTPVAGPADAERDSQSFATDPPPVPDGSVSPDVAPDAVNAGDVDPAPAPRSLLAVPTDHDPTDGDAKNAIVVLAVAVICAAASWQVLRRAGTGAAEVGTS